MTVAKDVVQFLMNIFGDRQAAQEFLNNPEGVLQGHGLGGMSSADVDAAMPVVLDYAPVNVNASTFDKIVTAGAGSSAGGTYDDHGYAVQQLVQVVANYSYPSAAEDRIAVPDQSPEHNIWADGDVEQWFDDDAAAGLDSPALESGPWMSLTDSRINHLFDLDPGTDEETVLVPIPDNSIEESFSHPTVAEAVLEVSTAGTDDGEASFSREEPGSTDGEDDGNDGGGEAPDYLEFGA